MQKLSKMLMVVGVIAAGSVQATMVNVGLGAYSAGGYYSYLDGDGASFAQSFVGQTMSGNDLIGAPSNPLTLNVGASNLWTQTWDGSVSILPQPNNQAPLSILFDTDADQLSWRMGYADNPGLNLSLDFFNNNGNIVESRQVSLLSGYNDYSLTLSSAFKGVSIYNNNDGAGLRFQNFSYNSATSSVPEPSTLVFFCMGIFSLVGFGFRRK